MPNSHGVQTSGRKRSEDLQARQKTLVAHAYSIPPERYCHLGIIRRPASTIDYDCAKARGKVSSGRDCAQSVVAYFIEHIKGQLLVYKAAASADHRLAIALDIPRET